MSCPEALQCHGGKVGAYSLDWTHLSLLQQQKLQVSQQFYATSWEKGFFLVFPFPFFFSPCLLFQAVRHPDLGLVIP